MPYCIFCVGPKGEQGYYLESDSIGLYCPNCFTYFEFENKTLTALECDGTLHKFKYKGEINLDGL